MATSILFILILSTTFQHYATSSTIHHPKKFPSPPSTIGGSGGISGLFPWGNRPPVTQCSTEILKLGLCLDVLGGLVHVGLGNAVENYCCPVLEGLLELEAAVCLCTAIKLKVLNLDIYIPLSLQVLVTCGKSPPPGYVCTLN